MNNQILEITDNYIYDIKFKHLEYFPMVNSRMFSIGGLENQDDIKFKDLPLLLSMIDLP